MAGEEELVVMDQVVPLAGGIFPYVLSWRPDSAFSQVDLEAVFLVVLKREHGLIGALPLGAISDQELEAGQLARDGQALLGPSTAIMTTGVHFDASGVVSDVDEQVGVLLADFDESVLVHLRPLGEEEPILSFHPGLPHVFPQPEDTIAKALEWLQSQLSEDLGNLYSHEVTAESAEAPVSPKQPAKSRSARAPPGLGKATDSGKAKAKRPTTASLAASLEVLMESLPQMSSSIQALTLKTSELEQQISQSSSIPKQLAQPLAASVSFAKRSSLDEAVQLLKSPPPRTKMIPSPPMWSPPPKAPAAVLDLEMDRDMGAPSIAEAMLAQSAALTNLVAHIAAGSQDPLVDLSSSGFSSTSVKGAQGRAKLQMELAAHKGVFFDSVVNALARRMSPTAPVQDYQHARLSSLGLTGTRYLERFGGYGRHKELGILQFQLMSILDYLMVDNVLAAKDILALTIVMVEQACLDNGRFEVAQVVSLMEDPPASVFTMRQGGQMSRARAFAPLADQRWITVALSFLKELDTISSKRSEFVNAKGSSSGGGGDSGDQQKQKAKAKKKGKGKGAVVETEELE